MNKYANIDTVQFPIVTISFSEVEPTVEEFKAYLNEMDKMYDIQGKRVIIFDATKTKYLSSELRIMQGHWLKERKEKIKGLVPLMVFIIPNPLVKIVFKGILIVEPLPAPYKLAKNFEEAFALAKQTIEREATV